MKLEPGQPRLTREDKARAWAWLRRVAEYSDEAAIACIEWTRLAKKEQSGGDRRALYILLTVAAACYAIWALSI